MNKEYIAIAIIFLLIGFSVGYTYGAYQMLNWGVDVAIKLLKNQGIELELDADTIVRGIYSYKNNIGNCLQDALILNNTGN